MQTHIAIKRVYAPASHDDGFRILVDRLWPRGISKEKAALDLWLKDIAPSDELRRRFHHEESSWAEFQQKYIHELQGNAEAVRQLRDALQDKDKVTLLYGAHDEQHNQAVVLRDFLLEQQP